MTKDEWLSADEETRPAIRLCVSQANSVAKVPTSVSGSCAWCSEAIWVDAAQEMPAIARERGIITICADCVLTEPDIAIAVMSGLWDVYKHWLETGTVKPIRFGNEE